MNGDQACSNSSSSSRFFVPESEAVNFHGCKLLLPCVSVGNVGQLAVDLIVSTLEMQRVGWIQDTALLPLVGNDAFDHTPGRGYMHTSAEVYWRDDLKLAVMQFRSPLAKNGSKGFCRRLMGWVNQENFGDVIVLTSSHAHERRDDQLSGPPYRFVLNSQCADLLDYFTTRLGWVSLELRNERDEVSSSSPVLFLPGSGFAQHLITQSSTDGVRLVVLVKFCSQGDNIQDAVGLATHLNAWLKMVQSTDGNKTAWRFLDSWRLMYGTPHPSELY